MFVIDGGSNESDLTRTPQEVNCVPPPPVGSDLSCQIIEVINVVDNSNNLFPFLTVTSLILLRCRSDRRLTNQDVPGDDTAPQGSGHPPNPSSLLTCGW